MQASRQAGIDNLRPPLERGSSRCMTDVHLRKHEAVRGCGSYEVWFDDGRPSKFFYFDLPNRRRLKRSLLLNEKRWGTDGLGPCPSLSFLANVAQVPRFPCYR